MGLLKTIQAVRCGRLTVVGVDRSRKGMQAAYLPLSQVREHLERVFPATPLASAEVARLLRISHTALATFTRWAAVDQWWSFR